MKKFLTILLTVALTATLAIGGTMAYLSDTDSDVNVMTTGNVKIEQLEKQRAEGVEHTGLAAEGNLIDFKQGQALYPAYAENNKAYTAEPTELFYWGPYVTADSAGDETGAGNGLWNDEILNGAMDKMIFVENTGKSDCYYRTIIAFECPEGMEYGQNSDKEFMMNINGSKKFFEWEDAGFIIINETRYLVEVATYNEVLPAGTVSRPSLLQVVMTHNATNEDMELLGDTYEILAVSQACQITNFPDAKTALDTAFGEVEEENVKEWFGNIEGPAVVSTEEELTEALTNGESVVLTKDITLTSGISLNGKEVTIYGSGNSITCDSKTVIHLQNTKLNLNDVELVGNGKNTAINVYGQTGNKLNMSNCTISNVATGITALKADVGTNSYSIGTLKNLVINASEKGIDLCGVNAELIEGCTVTAKTALEVATGWEGQYGANTTIKDCKLNGNVTLGTRWMTGEANISLGIDNCTINGTMHANVNSGGSGNKISVTAITGELIKTNVWDGINYTYTPAQ